MNSRRLKPRLRASLPKLPIDQLECELHRRTASVANIRSDLAYELECLDMVTVELYKRREKAKPPLSDRAAELTAVLQPKDRNAKTAPRRQNGIAKTADPSDGDL